MIRVPLSEITFKDTFNEINISKSNSNANSNNMLQNIDKTITNENANMYAVNYTEKIQSYQKPHQITINSTFFTDFNKTINMITPNKLREDKDDNSIIKKSLRKTGSSNRYKHKPKINWLKRQVNKDMINKDQKTITNPILLYKITPKKVLSHIFEQAKENSTEKYHKNNDFILGNDQVSLIKNPPENLNKINTKDNDKNQVLCLNFINPSTKKLNLHGIKIEFNKTISMPSSYGKEVVRFVVQLTHQLEEYNFTVIIKAFLFSLIFVFVKFHMILRS